MLRKSSGKNFSAENIGHAVDTLQVTETHTNSSATLPIRIDNTAVDVSIGWREGVASDDVTIGHHPTVAKCTGQDSPFEGRGRKIYEHGGSDSPAKRRK